jgi:hypothetical protein
LYLFVKTKTRVSLGRDQLRFWTLYELLIFFNLYQFSPKHLEFFLWSFLIFQYK